VKDPTFPPQGNFALLYQEGLITSKHVHQTSKGNGNVRTSLEVQIWFYSFLRLTSPTGATDLA
jgi:hypothetical protein